MKRASLADAERFPLGSREGPVVCHVLRDTFGRAPGEARRRSRVIPLGLWVAGGFLFLAALWTAMFVVARTARIESVPLAPREARP